MPNLTSMLGPNGLASETQGALADTAVQPADLTAYRELTDTALPRYDLAVAATTATLDLAAQQVFTVDATTTARTLSFANAPGGGRTMVVVIDISGSNTITWPTVTWSGGTAPELKFSWTEVTLLWNGTTWRGFKSGGAD